MPRRSDAWDPELAARCETEAWGELRKLIPQQFLISCWGTPMSTDNALKALVDSWKWHRDRRIKHEVERPREANAESVAEIADGTPLDAADAVRQLRLDILCQEDSDDKEHTDHVIAALAHLELGRIELARASRRSPPKVSS